MLDVCICCSVFVSYKITPCYWCSCISVLLLQWPPLFVPAVFSAAISTVNSVFVVFSNNIRIMGRCGLISNTEIQGTKPTVHTKPSLIVFENSQVLHFWRRCKEETMVPWKRGREHVSAWEVWEERVSHTKACLWMSQQQCGRAECIQAYRDAQRQLVCERKMRLPTFCEHQTAYTTPGSLWRFVKPT